MKRRRPEWLRKKRNITEDVLTTLGRVKSCGLHTVCESARCPNLSDCFEKGVATVMIMGDHCTRGCLFCAVSHGPSSLPDPQEGERIAHYAREASLSYLVITSVTRDDLADGGSSHFCRVVTGIKKLLPRLKIEILVPDFQGRIESIREVASLPVEVFGHNLETVERLYSVARQGASYRRSLDLLQEAARINDETTMIKSGIMVGLGEGETELNQLFSDLCDVGLQILTIGQYLQPSKNHLSVEKYYSPQEFDVLKEMALKKGIPSVVAGPYVRSSYLAENSYALARKSPK